MITYNRLWETMKTRGISQYHLIKREKFSAGQIARLKNNLTVSTQTLDTLCRILCCPIEDIVTYIPDNGEPLPKSAQNPVAETIYQGASDTDTGTDADTNADTNTNTTKEKKTPSLYAKAKKGIKISKKASKKASKNDKVDKGDKAEKSEKKAKKKNKEKDKDNRL